MTEFDDGSVLRIQPLRTHRDEAIYECTATNSVGEINTSAKLTVLEGKTRLTDVPHGAVLSLLHPLKLKGFSCSCVLIGTRVDTLNDSSGLGRGWGLGGGGPGFMKKVYALVLMPGLLGAVHLGSDHVNAGSEQGSRHTGQK